MTSWELGEEEELDMKHRIESGETRKEGEPGGVPRSMGTRVLCGRYLQFWVSRYLVRHPHCWILNTRYLALDSFCI